jgi:hypothetical protein
MVKSRVTAMRVESARRAEATAKMAMENERFFGTRDACRHGSLGISYALREKHLLHKVKRTR